MYREILAPLKAITGFMSGGPNSLNNIIKMYNLNGNI